MWLPSIVRDEGGQDTVEYSLLIALIVILGAAMFPTNIEAIATICAKTQEQLDRATQSGWQ